VDTGSPKPSNKLELIKGQLGRNIGIVTCEQTGLFSDKNIEQAPGVRFTKVVDVEGDWHFAKRETQFWKAIAVEGHRVSAAWIGKVSQDADFVPSRLMRRLEGQLVPAGGLLLENGHADYGSPGNLEVYSHQEIMDPLRLEMTAMPAMSLFCFSVVTVDTGSPKPSYELEIIKGQSGRNIGIFACEQTGRDTGSAQAGS